MQVLLDESLPRDFARRLVGHDVRTVRQIGWAGVRNGELLRRAAGAGFAVLVTADRKLEHQQNIGKAGLGVVVLRLRSNRIEDVEPFAPAVLDALERIRAGQVVHVER